MKVLAGTNALPYFVEALMTMKKSFIVLTVGMKISRNQKPKKFIFCLF
jgi:hypothetical protein